MAARWRKPKPLGCASSSSWQPQNSESRAMPDVRFSVRLYRWFLKLYPAGFRENYAGQLERQFLDEISLSHGPCSLAMLWIRMLSDLSVSVPHQFGREVTQDGRHALRLWSR